MLYVIKNESERWAWFARDLCIVKCLHQYSLAFISWILNMKIWYATSSVSAVNKRLLPFITIIHIYISRYAYICYHLSIFNRSFWLDYDYDIKLILFFHKFEIFVTCSNNFDVALHRKHNFLFEIADICDWYEDYKALSCMSIVAYKTILTNIYYRECLL